MFADLIFNLNENESYDSNLSLKIQKTSNSTYFRVHDINTALVDSENTDLKNEIKYSFSKDDVYLDINATVYENLREKKIQTNMNIYCQIYYMEKLFLVKNLEQLI